MKITTRSLAADDEIFLTESVREARLYGSVATKFLDIVLLFLYGWL